MALIIVESPNKIPKIKKAVGSNYVVMASVGHIMDLSKSKMGVDIPSFKTHYEINQDKREVVKNLKEEAKNHKEIFIATDFDKEGECIAFNLRDVLPTEDKVVERVVFSTMTTPDIMSGLNNPIGFRESVYNAQQARRITDRIVGFKVSPLMWTKGLRGTSAGRVQSAALKFVVDREKEIRAFKQEEYWTIAANLNGFSAEFWGINGKKFVPSNQVEADDIIADINPSLSVSEYQNKSRTREPLPPFITSTMQKDAGTAFGWTAQRVMDLAQSLFSQGLITYHRTDSTRNEPGKVKDLRDRIEKIHGKNYLSPSIRVYGPSAASQDAHEAIRPTYEPEPMNMVSDEIKLLELIKNRFMASQMADAEFDQAAVKLEGTGKKGKYEFRATGSILKFDGFLKVYGSSTQNVSLPNLSKGQNLNVIGYVPSQHFTKPPPRYTEPAFTDKMEKEGIGRPATYAATIETLLKRKYVAREKKALKATEIGIMVCEYLEKHFEKLTSPEFTSDMELEMDQIAEGKLELVTTLEKFYNDLEKTIEVAVKDKSTDLFKTDKECPDCNNGNNLIRKVGKFGVFLGCEGYPQCGYTLVINEDGEETEAKVETGVPCPECGNKITKKKGKFGEFYGCSSYPTCKWTGKLDGDGNIVDNKKPQAEETDMDCAECGKGKMVKRSGKFGDFLGCNQYPTCKNIINLDKDGNPAPKKSAAKTAKKPLVSTGKKCPKCKSDLVERNGKFGKFISCSGYPNCKHIEK